MGDGIPIIISMTIGTESVAAAAAPYHAAAAVGCARHVHGAG